MILASLGVVAVGSDFDANHSLRPFTSTGSYGSWKLVIYYSEKVGRYGFIKGNSFNARRTSTVIISFRRRAQAFQR